jgi:hypothetical protein
MWSGEGVDARLLLNSNCIYRMIGNSRPIARLLHFCALGSCSPYSRPLQVQQRSFRILGDRRFKFTKNGIDTILCTPTGEWPV